MYESYYGFTIKPFQIVPNPDFLYLNAKYQNALTYMEYGLMEKTGFILLTGEVGSGKTTLIKHLLRQIEADFDVAALFNTGVSPEELLHMILTEFEIGPAEGGKAHALDLLNEYLIGCYARNRRALIIIDEAQNLSRESLEEVRMLSNLQSDDQMLVQIILVGQPEIRERLRAQDMVQLNQRISVAFHLPALTRDETGEYIAYRLEKAQGKARLFTPEAVDLIFNASGGIPRTINILCDSALVYGFADELPIIDAPLIEQVLADRDGMGLGSGPQKDAVPHSVIVAGDVGSVASRLDAIENMLARLHARLDLNMNVVDKTADCGGEEILTVLKNLCEVEREKTGTLMHQYALLEERYQALQEEQIRRGKTYSELIDGIKVLMEELKAAAAQLIAENRILRDKSSRIDTIFRNLPDGNRKKSRLHNFIASIWKSNYRD